MKQIFFRKKMILFVCSIIFMSCSKEEVVTNENLEKVNNAQFFQRSSTEGYEEYAELLSELYGSDFDLESTVLYEEREGNYFVTKVNLNNNLEGYFVELPDENVVYLEHNMNNGNLDYYDYDDVNGVVVLTSYDLTLDATYNYSPLNPDTNAPQGRRFWGWVISDGACGPNSNGDGGCSYGTYKQKFVFWTAVSDPVATGDVHPCPCP